MKIEIPKIEQVRKSSGEQFDRLLEAQREEVVSEILKSKDTSYHCVIEHSIFDELARELVIAGYNVRRMYLSSGERTMISW